MRNIPLSDLAVVNRVLKDVVHLQPALRWHCLKKEMGLNDFESCALRTEPQAVITTCSDDSPTPQNPPPGGT